MNIIVDLNTPIHDGMEVVFRSPVDCSQVTGLKVNHIEGSKEFAFADAHGNNVGDIDHLFAENAVVKVILDVTTGMAFVQNADTNAYLEQRFDDIEENISPIVCDAVGEVIALSDASNKKLQGLTVYGKTTQNGTPTPDAPIELVSAGNEGVVNIAVYGKNLLDTEAIVKKAQYSNTQTFTLNISGTTLTISGTPTEAWWQSSTTFLPVPKDWRGKKMRFGATLSGNQPNTLIYFRKSATPGSSDLLSTIGLSGVGNVSKTFTVPDEAAYYNVVFCLNQGTTGSAFTATYSDMYLSDAEAEDGYEQYKGRQTLSVPTPNGLPGIPVASGGNYTDASGQQWLCDEIDFARGVYVQNIYTRVFDGTEAFVVGSMTSGADHYRYSIKDSKQKGYDSTTVFDGYVSHYGKTTANSGFLGKAPNRVAIRPEDINFYVYEATVAEFKAFLAENPVTLMCPLAEPVPTELPEEALAAYTAPHTNKPNTTIYNDAGTGMKVSYVADTKAYIDNKFAELAAAIINNT